MSFKDWIRQTKENFSEYSYKRAFSESLYELYKSGWRNFGKYYNYGTPIWEKEWDVLLILDACRYDTFNMMYSGQNWYQYIDSINSIGSMSSDWMEKTFIEEHSEEIENTVYITGNPYSKDMIDDSMFMNVEHVWKSHWDDDIGTIRPDKITDVAINTKRELQPEKLIVHYMQPHTPYIGEKKLGDVNEIENVKDPSRFEYYGGLETEIDLLRKGVITKDEHDSMYQSNIELVVENIRTNLLGNVDGKVVLTADHGNAFGEFGLYGHPKYVPIKPVKRVPWCVVNSTDNKNYNPEVKLQDLDDTEDDVKERLESLGYK